MYFHRKSIRLKGYDYSEDGYYYVTMCTSARINFFGMSFRDKIVLNDLGKQIENVIKNISINYPLIEIDEYCIMPNHIHWIIIIKNDENITDDGDKQCIKNVGVDHDNENITDDKNEQYCKNVGVDLRVDPGNEINDPGNNENIIRRDDKNIIGRTRRSAPTNMDTLGKFIKKFKTYTIKIANQKSFWQRNYYEHIIRNEKEYWAIKQYIKNNPENWLKDRNNV